VFVSIKLAFLTLLNDSSVKCAVYLVLVLLCRLLHLPHLSYFNIPFGIVYIYVSIIVVANSSNAFGNSYKIN
jgi:hypothetical protein